MYWDLPTEKGRNKFGSKASLRTRQPIKWRVSLFPRVRKTIRPIRCCVSFFWRVSRNKVIFIQLAAFNFFKEIFCKCWTLRWLDWIFFGGYLPSLSINYVAMSKDMKKTLPQLYYIKTKISCDLGFMQSESPWQHNDAITFFIYLCVLYIKSFFFLRNRLREFVPATIASIMAKFEQIVWERFRNISKS